LAKYDKWWCSNFRKIGTVSKYKDIIILYIFYQALYTVKNFQGLWKCDILIMLVELILIHNILYIIIRYLIRIRNILKNYIKNNISWIVNIIYYQYYLNLKRVNFARYYWLTLFWTLCDWIYRDLHITIY